MSKLYKPSGPSRANTASSIRGKISAPIPIPDDEEFPIRSPGTGIATPLDAGVIDKQLRLPTAGHGIAVSDFSEPRAPSTQRSYTEGSIINPPRHTLQTTLRDSEISQPSGDSSLEKPQRKKTSLKSVLGRLFGTKKGRLARSSAQNSPTAKAGQHRSDPSALARNNVETSSQKRVASLPINEYNRALRSHSPFTETFPLETPPDNAPGTPTLAERRARTRRATTPSRLFEPGPDNGLAPRPAARDSRLFTDDEGQISAIGYAVTSGSHPNRRSRSLDGLRQATQAQLNNRRRSDEIRYWRQSHDVDALSPMSSQKPDQDLPSATQKEEHAEAGEIEAEEEKAAVKPFNFGPMGAMAGMKITEAASLENRMSQMEKKMFQMEKLICQMQGISATPSGLSLQDPFQGPSSAVPRKSSLKRPTDESSVYSLPRPVDRPRMKGSSRRSSSYSRPSTVETQASTTESTVTRDLSTSTTIRGMSSSSPPPLTDRDLSGEYNKLVSFITSEQQARLRLETIVGRLQNQLQEQIRIQSSHHPTTISTHHPNSPFQQTQNAEALMQRSAFEADDSSSDEEGNLDDFRTPNEEIGHYDMNPNMDFGVEDERERKKAVRTTSLSEFTLNKGRGALKA